MNRNSRGLLAKPLRYKTFLLTWFAIYPLINLILFLGNNLLNALPIYLRTLLLTGILVFLMTYVVMPRLNRYFYRWLRTSTKRVALDSNSQLHFPHSS